MPFDPRNHDYEWDIQVDPILFDEEHPGNNEAANPSPILRGAQMEPDMLFWDEWI